MLEVRRHHGNLAVRRPSINLLLAPLLLVLLHYVPIHSDATTTTPPSSSRRRAAAQRLKLRPTSTSTLSSSEREQQWSQRRKRFRTARSDEPRTSLTRAASSSSSSSSSSWSSRDCHISPMMERVHRGGEGFLSEILNNDAPTTTSSSYPSEAMTPPGTGAKGAANASFPKIVGAMMGGNNAKVAIASLVVAAAVALLSAIRNRDAGLLDPEKFRAWIVRTMGGVASLGDAGLILYALGFALWEVCGLPTSVVETAAGMAFGRTRGLAGSFAGKTCGSCMAFALGRTLLSGVVSSRVGGSEPFDSIVRGAARNPVRTAFVVRYSVFPQAVKNFGMALTTPVSFPVFLLSIVVHGLPFSTLWAALGDDAGSRLRASESGDGGEVIPANLVLNGLLAFVTVFGFVVSPAITGLWLADLRKEG